MKIEQWKINDLTPYGQNPRKNTEAVNKVMKSLEEFGWQQPIVVDKEGVVIVGHTRLKAAKKLKYSEVPVLIAEGLSPKKVQAYRLADNRTAEEAEWDVDLLKCELKDLDGMFTGFDDEEIERLFLEQETDVGEDDIPPTPHEDEAVSQLGDVWLCGKHKVVCGSSTEKEAYDLLLGDEEVDMIWTDPPYNIDYESPAKRAIREGSIGGTYKGLTGAQLSKDTDTIANDNMSTEAFAEFLSDAFEQGAAVTKKGGCIYVAFSEKEGTTFRVALDKHFMYKQTLVWVKDRMVFGRQDYNHQYEPIMYGWKEGAGHYWSGDFTQTTVLDHRTEFSTMKKEELIELLNMVADSSDVIDVPKPAKSDLHPTMKPVALIEKQIESSSEYGDIVLDMFGGSGSTMIAATRQGRAARLIELAPKYVDVIVTRWQEYAKDTAVLQGTEDSFSTVKTDRGIE